MKWQNAGMVTLLKIMETSIFLFGNFQLKKIMVKQLLLNKIERLKQLSNNRIQEQ
jgi:hypothetical protein